MLATPAARGKSLSALLHLLEHFGAHECKIRGDRSCSPDAVASISAVPTRVLDKLVHITEGSAGSAIPGLRHASAHSPFIRPLGESRDDVIGNLETGFAHAAAWSIGLSSLFLVIGLLGAIMVRYEARRQVG